MRWRAEMARMRLREDMKGIIEEASCGSRGGKW